MLVGSACQVLPGAAPVLGRLRVPGPRAPQDILSGIGAIGVGIGVARVVAIAYTEYGQAAGERG
jgi:hypothetical protein